MPMRRHIVHPESERAPRPLPQVILDAAADVDEGLEFWKTIVGTVPAKHRASREFLNRHG